MTIVTIPCLGLFTKNNSFIEINNNDGNHDDESHDRLWTDSWVHRKLKDSYVNL